MKLQCGIVLARFAPMQPMGSRKAILAVFPLLMACRQIVGIEPRQVFNGDASDTTLLACGLPNRGAACTACMTEKCCTKAQQCVDDQLCISTEQCLQACASGDWPCRLGCSKQWDPVNTVQTRLEACRDQNCADACGPWECLGNVRWQIPNPFPAMITIRATIMCGACSSIGGIDPNEGVRVRVCSIADTNCDAELTSGTSGLDGSVSLRINTAINGQTKPQSVFLEFHKVGFLDNLLMLNTPPLSYDFNVGIVNMDTRESVDQIARDIATLLNTNTTYDPNLAFVKLQVSNCNLRPAPGIDLGWADQGGAVIASAPGGSDMYTVNLPVPDVRRTGDAASSAGGLTRVVARLKEPDPVKPMSLDAETHRIIAVANMVVRPGAITLAPFVTPTP
jgi:hypothetical protein